MDSSLEQGVRRTAAVVVTWNHVEHLRSNLPTLLAQRLPFHRVLVVDNGSTDETSAYLDAKPGVERIALRRNHGFAGGANRGIERALSDPAVGLIALVNDDVALDADWHGEAQSALLAATDRGACATCLVQEGNPALVDTAGIEWAAPGLAGNHLHGRPVPSPSQPPYPVPGACAAAALYRRQLWEEVGYFDESLFAYQEDVDLALRAAVAGWSTVLAPAARGAHRGHGSNRPFPLGGSWADFYNARNRITVLLKSLPERDWRAHWRSIARAQVRLLVDSLAERRAGAVAAGQLHALLIAPRSLGARRRRQAPGHAAATFRGEASR